MLLTMVSIPLCVLTAIFLTPMTSGSVDDYPVCVGFPVVECWVVGGGVLGMVLVSVLVLVAAVVVVVGSVLGVAECGLAADGAVVVADCLVQPADLIQHFVGY